jgi:DNA repair exonuclease SbcCD ATPase subunit
MNKFVLLLVLLSGFLSGYLIGDYRGKDARETLKKAVEIGKVLDTERDATIAKLKNELGDINDKHLHELDAIRKDTEAKTSEWRRAKDALDERIKRSTVQLSDSDSKLKSLATLREDATGNEKDTLDQEIAQLRKQRENLRREIEGNACLHAQVPHSVFDALNETITGGRK